MQQELVFSSQHMGANRDMLFILKYPHDPSIDKCSPRGARGRKVKRQEWLR